MNDNDTSQQGGTLGRKIDVTAFGDNADEIELYALDEARRFFGADIPLEIVRAYQVHRLGPMASLAKDAGGKVYVATVTVRERAGS
jgi:hypothetical protein